ncbi:amidohydrolase family protein [uncultured Muriicola sp.]|uniref:amidohydrolase family protein n=1 Tax=uncultured Muriicola sp. TaxID=1583102 RepID=UPI00260381B4|nr:amidohydrolase family protein [uncultured Muriicola sp.]
MQRLFILIFVLLLGSCQEIPEQKKSSAILISDVSILDVSTGEIMEHKSIEIDSGKIRRITGILKDTTGFQTVIDGKGKYVMPGLAEMHAHIPAPPISQEQLEETLFLYLSNGITTIRGMLGHPSHLELKKLVAKGKVLGPRVFTSSPSLNGNTVRTVEEAEAKVTEYQKDGYDFLKIHPGILRPVFDQIVTTAKEVNIPFAGHVPVDVGIRHALKSGYASIDHVDGYLEGLVPETAGVNPRENGFFGYDFTKLADTSLIPSLVSLSKENKVWIVPTQSLFERWFAPVSADQLLNEPEMIYMPVTTLTNWKIRKEQTMGKGTNFSKAQWERFNAIRLQLIKALQDNGHGILLGSDAPQLFNVPGFSIHHEIVGMINAGLTPFQIIQSGTLNPAIYFEQQEVFGQIKEGMVADLLLLRENPMEDIKALKKLDGVMLGGKWIDRKSIDKKLKVIASHAENQ